MQILTTVTVNQILTEKSREKLFHTFQNRKQALQKEIDQLKFEKKRLEKTKKYNIKMLHNYFEKEIENRNEKIKLLEFQIEQLEILPLGSQLKEREVQGLVNVEVGDKWNDNLNKTIVVKDGVITEIRGE
ncbi:YlqD family protein [Caldibacillus thermolactis]|jgi:hypothetical protein|uniref:YlqD family protein n=1 Tax=Pallidibacillus thermolactis TaxID=251051 RepID=A0ABT2WDX3_9BACI|nr:YlqD family protein [Pallidibacillus thermolactis]MCU9593116.1 YlqD family protein [Pallidibacillus thermolactis]MCU9600120.1 YlqD family protein [Pallidibacillus thermolactis subsp. kokeshiiformis]MED1671983.1 YlqD family protein [Pallidibacillus thermolactis subsp. kokeshiiformis]